MSDSFESTVAPPMCYKTGNNIDFDIARVNMTAWESIILLCRWPDVIRRCHNGNNRRKKISIGQTRMPLRISVAKTVQTNEDRKWC